MCSVSGGRSVFVVMPPAWAWAWKLSCESVLGSRREARSDDHDWVASLRKKSDWEKTDQVLKCASAAIRHYWVLISSVLASSLSRPCADLSTVTFLRSSAYPNIYAVCAFLSIFFLIKDFRNYQRIFIIVTTFFIYTLFSVHGLKKNQTLSVLSLPLASYDYIERVTSTFIHFRKQQALWLLVLPEDKTSSEQLNIGDSKVITAFWNNERLACEWVFGDKIQQKQRED